MKYVVNSAIAEYVKKEGLQVSADLADEINEEVQYLLDRAIERAQKNQRRTVMGRDV